MDDFCKVLIVVLCLLLPVFLDVLSEYVSEETQILRMTASVGRSLIVSEDHPVFFSLLKEEVGLCAPSCSSWSNSVDSAELEA